MAITKTDSKTVPWCVDYRDRTGKRHRKSFRTQKEAKAYESNQSQQLSKGTWVDPNLADKTTVRQLYAMWLGRVTTVGARGRRPINLKTLDGYESAWRTHIEPHWGDTFLSSVTYPEVASWVTTMRATVGTRVKVANQFGRIMSEAVRHQLLSTNPTKDPAGHRDYIPDAPVEKKVFLTAKQLMTFKSVFQPPYDLMVLTAGTCGPRWGEITALPHNMLDLSSKPLMRIEGAFTDVAGRVYAGDTKTHEGRNVPIPELVAEELRKHTVDNPGLTVFRSPSGGVLRASNFRTRVWLPALAEAKTLDKTLPDFTFHSLRHTAVSLAIKGGANIKVVQAIAGHKSATVTLDTYGGLFMDDLHDSAARVNSMLRVDGQ